MHRKRRLEDFDPMRMKKLKPKSFSPPRSFHETSPSPSLLQKLKARKMSPKMIKEMPKKKLMKRRSSEPEKKPMMIKRKKRPDRGGGSSSESDSDENCAAKKCLKPTGKEVCMFCVFDGFVVRRCRAIRDTFTIILKISHLKRALG